MGILDIGSFETNSKAINNAYETYVLGVGDFDERIFLGEDANAEIGTPAKSSTSDQGTLTERITVKKDLRHSFEVCVLRVPTRPGKPGKMRVHLENLEISWNLEKFNKYHGKIT